MGNLAEQILYAAKTSFVDSSFESEEELRPKLVYNDDSKGNTVLANIEKELNQCESFWFSVAFITKSGLIVLKETLKELKEKGIKGRILTTDYLTFNEPDALRELLQHYDNIEVKVFTNENFHTKGYMFLNKEKHTFIVGSSNLTQYALKANKEWNLKITSLEKGELIRETDNEFASMWQQAIPLTMDWIREEYEPIWKEKRKIEREQKVVRIKSYKLDPNKMQIEATQNLARLREQKQNKALLISATGTGKTYLSAFDVRNFISYNNKPIKLLFLVHRKRILEQAIESFKDVMGENISTGILTGDYRCDIFGVDFLFSTTSMMSKENIYQLFDKNYFDYIIVDETHRAGADGYLRFLSYFEPKFLLGMTATPERPDGFDVYQLYDHNIAYEVRLNKAMEENLLCPFHYFGITELVIDGNVINDGDFETIFPFLISEERVNHIISKTKFYGNSGNRVKGLIFCRNIKEADELSRLFNLKGYRTVSINSKNDVNIEESISKLEQEEWHDGLDYIFTVDMFNEGIDIPEVNQIVMLRPTQSSVVFIQQLGRGLRKAPAKEYVVVLDFIGNYAKNFLIPIALSGDRSYNKDTIRKFIAEGNRVIPGCSTVNFDAIAKQRIYASINNNNFSTFKFLKDEYENLKNKIGKIPMLMDFYTNGSVDPIILLEYSKSYYGFVKKVEKEYSVVLNNKEMGMLEYISSNIANGKRPHELIILEKLFDFENVSVELITIELKKRYKIENDQASIYNAFEVLEGKNIAMKTESYRYMEYQLAKSVESGMLQRCITYYEGIKNREFIHYLRDMIAYGLSTYSEKYSNRYLETNMVIYKKYSRKDVCRLLNWDKDESGTINGYRVKHNTCPIFVTYRKSENISDSTKYEDEFLDKSTFSWMTRHGLTIEKSKEVKAIMNAKESGLKIHLFVKKEDGEGKDFYYMGEMDPITGSARDTVIMNGGKKLPIVNILFRMKDQVQEDIYEYIITD